MPFDKKNELPDSVKSVLDSHAQDIYKEAFSIAPGSNMRALVRDGAARVVKKLRIKLPGVR